jgi:Fibronectin type III domain
VATNAVGDGPASAPSNSVTLRTVPGAPRNVTAVAADAQATVSWSAPASDGGSTVTGYTVTSSPGAKTCTTTGALNCTVSNLTNGAAYTFTVTATNVIGTGPASSASNSVIPRGLYQPDGRIKKGRGSLIGNDIYNADATNQTLQATKRPRRSVIALADGGETAMDSWRRCS